MIPLNCRLPRCLENSKGEGKDKDVRVVTNLVTGDVPIRDEGIISVSERSIVSHGGSAPVGVLALSKELID